MRTRDELKEETIREKAIELIVRKGFDGFSMQKLARAAGVSPATLYIYFKNREDLVNSLYNRVNQTFTRVALENFSPQDTLEAGLWTQWKNRMRFILEYPDYYQFYEQFRNSPLILHEEVKSQDFKENMREFVKNAIRRGELTRIEPETFWALAYGPFYTLMKFHLQGHSMMNEHYEITDAKLKALLKRVLITLKP